MGMEVAEEVMLRKIGKKSKEHKKDEPHTMEVTIDCREATHKRANDSVNLSKEDKKKKKEKKKKHGLCDDVEFNLRQNEAKNVRDYVEVVMGNNDEKDRKKKMKKRKSEVDKNEKEYEKVKKKDRRINNDQETTEIKEVSNEKTHVGGEEGNSLQTNDKKVLGNDCELEARKEKKRRHKKNENRDGVDAINSFLEIVEDKEMGKDKVTKGKKTIEKEDVAELKNVEDGNTKNIKKKKKRGKREREGSDVEGKKIIADENEAVHTIDLSKNPKSKGTSKRVRFSGHVEVFPSCDGPSIGNKDKEDDLVRGKRFSPKEGHVEVFPSCDGPSIGKKDKEDDLVRGKRFSPKEDEMIKEAVLNYIEAHDLGEEGLDMVLHCKSHPIVRNCWKEIGTVLPQRPYSSIYYRAHILFERDESRKWTTEEYEIIRRYHEQHGSDWKMLADALGKHRFHVKDTWRRIKLPNKKKGHWSQEEYQTLFDLVNADLRMKAFEEKKSKHGMLRDNICWEAISDKLSTRINASCCQKWYNQLTSSMVAEGKWDDVDDYRLLMELFSLDACCLEDVDWDNLLEHRSGDVCRKRWNQMVKHIGENGSKSFAEQVEILSERYCPEMLEAREAYDSKPAVP